MNFRNFIFFFPKAKLASIAVATFDNFNAGKGKKKDIKLGLSFVRSIYGEAKYWQLNDERQLALKG